MSRIARFASHSTDEENRKEPKSLYIKSTEGKFWIHEILIKGDQLAGLDLRKSCAKHKLKL